MLLPVGNILLKFCASGENNLMFNIKLLELFIRKMASDIPNFTSKVLQNPMRNLLTVGLTCSRWGMGSVLNTAVKQQQGTHLVAATSRIRLGLDREFGLIFLSLTFSLWAHMRSGSPPLDTGQALLGLLLFPSPLFRVKPGQKARSHTSAFFSEGTYSFPSWKCLKFSWLWSYLKVTSFRVIW